MINNLTIPVQISLAKHFIDLLIGHLQFLTGHEAKEFGTRNETIAVRIKLTNKCLDKKILFK